jgi:hypothetical protein
MVEIEFHGGSGAGGSVHSVSWVAALSHVAVASRLGRGAGCWAGGSAALLVAQGGEHGGRRGAAAAIAAGGGASVSLWSRA